MKNEYNVLENHVEIIIRQRNGNIHKVLVSHESMEKLKEFNHKWHVYHNRNNNSYYACSTVYKGTFNGKTKYENVRMNRFLVEAKEGEYVDHINHNTLDNRLENLRKLNNSDNTYHRKSANKNSSTGVRNVNLSSDGKYVVQFCKQGKRIRLGRFNSLDEAKKVANDFRKWA